MANIKCFTGFLLGFFRSNYDFLLWQKTIYLAFHIYLHVMHKVGGDATFFLQ